MADVNKIQLPDNSVINIKDYRIPGVDSTPTLGSDNVVTSGGVAGALAEKQDNIQSVEFIGSMYRTDVSGGGNITIRNTSGEFPTVTDAGTYIVSVKMSSNTSNYSVRVTFGNETYVLSTDNGIIDDKRSITVSANSSWSATMVNSVASGTVLNVRILKAVSSVTQIGLAAVTNDYNDLDNKPTIPSTISDLTTDASHRTVTDAEKNTWNGKYTKPQGGIPADDIAPGVIPDVSQFITKSVNDLTNYYLKSETYTKDEVAALIGAIQQFHYEIVATLPATGEGNVLYLVGPTGSGSDRYEEYVYANNQFTKIGDTSIDLSGYVTTTALNTALAAYTTSADLTTLLAGKQDTINDLADIRSGSQGNVKYTQQTLTDVQKAQARTNIGATTPEVFWAEYGVTTFADINAANNAGKVIKLKYPNSPYIYALINCANVDNNAGYAMFGVDRMITGVNQYYTECYTIRVLSINGNDTWDEPVTMRIENPGYKVSSWQNTPDDIHYPSEKLVKDSLNAKQDTIDASHKLDYSLLSNTPTIPAAQVNSDWNASSGVAQILNKPTIPPNKTLVLTDIPEDGIGCYWLDPDWTYCSWDELSDAFNGKYEAVYIHIAAYYDEDTQEYRKERYITTPIRLSSDYYEVGSSYIEFDIRGELIPDIFTCCIELGPTSYIQVSYRRAVPPLSTNIEQDKTHNDMTASPKAVADYVDAHSGAVRYDQAQTLTDAQKIQARTNIGATAPEIFWVEYGTTTLQEVTNAYNAGKLVICKYQSKFYTLSTLTETYCYFTAVNNTAYYRLLLNGANWSAGQGSLEVVGNKVTSLSSSSTDTQYPSAKLVYDSLAEKQDVIDANNKLDYSLIDNTPTIPIISTDIILDKTTDEKTASPKAVWDVIEDTALLDDTTIFSYEPVTVATTKNGVISQTITWTNNQYTLSNQVYGSIPQSNIDLFENCGASFNDTGADVTVTDLYGRSFTHKAGCFMMNGLGDLSYQEILTAYNYANISQPYAVANGMSSPRPLESSPARTNFWTFTQNWNTQVSFYMFACYNHVSNLTTVRLKNNDSDVYTGAMRQAFTSASRVEYIYPAIECSSQTGTGSAANSFYGAFDNMANLKEIRLKSLKISLSFKNSPNLSMNSIKYMIDNETSTSAFTITLHATAYNAAIADSGIQTSLSNHTNVTLASA